MSLASKRLDVFLVQTMFPLLITINFISFKFSRNFKCGLRFQIIYTFYFIRFDFILSGLCQGHALHTSPRRRWFIGRGQHQVAKDDPEHGCVVSLSPEKGQRLMNNKQCEPAHLMFIYQLFGRPPQLTRVQSSLDMASLHRHTVDIHRSRGNRGSRTGTSPSGFGHSQWGIVHGDGRRGHQGGGTGSSSGDSDRDDSHPNGHQEARRCGR